MVFPLQYSFLQETYPTWNIPESSSNELPVYDELENLAKDLKPFQKLRIIDDKLEIDTRFPQYIYRKRSGDSRQKILEKLKEFRKSPSLLKIVQVLCSTTYKNDNKFIEECRYFYDLKSNK